MEAVGFSLRNSEVLKSLNDQLVHLPVERQSEFKASVAEFSPPFRMSQGARLSLSIVWIG